MIAECLSLHFNDIHTSTSSIPAGSTLNIAIHFLVFKLMHPVMEIPRDDQPSRLNSSDSQCSKQHWISGHAASLPDRTFNTDWPCQFCLAVICGIYICKSSIHSTASFNNPTLIMQRPPFDPSVRHQICHLHSTVYTLVHVSISR